MSVFCSKCGAELTEGATFCNKCGTKVERNSEGDKSKDTNEEIKKDSQSNTVYWGASRPDMKKHWIAEDGSLCCPACKTEPIEPTLKDDSVYFICKRCGNTYRNLDEAKAEEGVLKLKKTMILSMSLFLSILSLVSAIMFLIFLAMPAEEYDVEKETYSIYQMADDYEDEQFEKKLKYIAISGGIMLLFGVLDEFMAMYWMDFSNKRLKIDMELKRYAKVGWGKYSDNPITNKLYKRGS